MPNDSSTLATVIIALIGLVTATITIFGGAVIYFGKWFSSHYGEDMKAHTHAANSQTETNKKLAVAVDKNTDSNVEVLAFMKNLNGKLSKAAIQTIQEQNVEHQTVNHQDEVK